jgi:Protein of unknown function (DUF3828)
MRLARFALAAFAFSSVVALSAATRIDDPKAFVTEVYRRLIETQSKGHSYSEPDDIYTARLAKLIRDDRKKAKGEVGCLEIDFWVNGQDWEITDLAVTSTDGGPDRKTVIAKFRNLGNPEEIHFDFRRNAGRWQLDDVRSLSAKAPWTLSEILKCTL